jgi:molybdopterin converting factor small subunit
MRSQPEFLEIYIRMANLERLLREIDCGQPREGSITIPPYLYPMVYERLAEARQRGGLPRFVVSFLASRVGDDFLRDYVEVQPRLIDLLSDLDAPLESNDNVSILLRAKSLGLVCEDQLDTLVERVVDVSIYTPDSAFETEIRFEELLGKARLESIREAVDAQFDDAFIDVLWNWESGYVDGTDPEDYLAPLYEAVENLGFSSLRIERIDAVREQLLEKYEEAEARSERDDDSYRDDALVNEASTSRSVFEDVDA